MRMSNEGSHWLECLDEEATTEQAKAYAAGLSADRRDLLAKEAALDAKIAGHLAESGECPDDVWQRTRELARERMTAPRVVRPHPWWVAPALAAAAVLLAVMVPLTVRQAPSVDPLAAAETPKTLSQEAFVSGSADRVHAFLTDRGYRLTVEDLPPSGKVNGHGVEFLGAGVVRHEAGEGVSLLYSCCGWPIRVVVARRGSSLAAALAEADREGRTSGYRTFGEYVAVAIGNHDGSEVLRLLG